MVRVNWLAVKTFGVFFGGALFILGALTVIVALMDGGDLEVGRTDTESYTAREQVWIGLVVALVGGLMAGIPFYQSLREIISIGRRRLRDREGGK